MVGEPTIAGDAAPVEVLVIGGGFAGLQVVRKLAGTPVHVTIVDQHNFHTFLPLLYQVATAGLEPADVAYPIRTIFGKSTNVTFRHGRAVGVDHARRTVALSNGDELAFDHLVLACGATAAFFGVPGAEQNAMPLYTLADARGLRNHLLLTLEAADVKGTGGAAPLTFVVVGGGPTGVETAGAVLELLEVCIRRDRLRIDPSTTKVILLDVAPRLLNGFPRSASTYAERALSRKGVEIRLGESVVEVGPDSVTLASGEQIETRTVVWAAGVTATGTMADHSGAAPGPAGRVSVASDLSVTGHRNVWAVGDGAAVPTGKADGVCPQLAPVAIQSGRHCAAQILNAVEGRPTTPFVYRNKGIMARSKR